MLRTPLKNSKSVNKPFKSPFAGATPATPTNEGQNKSFSKNVKQAGAANTPTSTRSLEAKRILNLDNEENQSKKRKLADGNQENRTVKAVPDSAKKSNLQLLKRKIFEMRQELDCLKSREQCTKKHDPEKLKESISKWNSACQTALETLSSELSERNGQSSSISDVLKMLNIPEEVVHYSEKDDAFV